jgi:hypothetical protein
MTLAKLNERLGIYFLEQNTRILIIVVYFLS